MSLLDRDEKPPLHGVFFLHVRQLGARLVLLKKYRSFSAMGFPLWHTPHAVYMYVSVHLHDCPWQYILSSVCVWGGGGVRSSSVLVVLLAECFSVDVIACQPWCNDGGFNFHSRTFGRAGAGLHCCGFFEEIFLF